MKGVDASSTKKIRRLDETSPLQARGEAENYDAHSVLTDRGLFGSPGPSTMYVCLMIRSIGPEPVVVVVRTTEYPVCELGTQPICAALSAGLLGGVRP